jgi:siroheme synthase-like protein
MAYYPVFLDLTGKRVVVIGGGRVAEDKIDGLVRAGAGGRITVVAPALTPALAGQRDAGAVQWLARPYQDGDLAGFDVCMVATDDGAVNAAVAAEGKRRRVWVNAADDPANCDFILPAVVRQGDVVLAASTSGASPALARRLREELTAFLSEDYAPLAELLAAVRQELRTAGVRIEAAAWQQALDARLRALVAQGRLDAARERLLAAFGVETPAGRPTG